jgi:hypothetical protein
MTLYELARDMRDALEALDDCETDEELQHLVDVISAMQDGLTDKADAYIRVMRNIATDCEALDAEIDRLTAMKKRREKTIDRLKDSMLQAMTMAGEDKIVTPLGTWSKRLAPWSAKVTDESKIEDRFLVPQPPKVDKAAILKEFKLTGEVFPGVEFERREYITLR